MPTLLGVQSLRVKLEAQLVSVTFLVTFWPKDTSPCAMFRRRWDVASEGRRQQTERAPTRQNNRLARAESTAVPSLFLPKIEK